MHWTSNAIATKDIGMHSIHHDSIIIVAQDVWNGPRQLGIMNPQVGEIVIQTVWQTPRQ
jgi:hypothetical protein